jgi:hypothetical protein
MTAKVYNRFSNPQLKTCFTLRVEVNEEHKKKKHIRSAIHPVKLINHLRLAISMSPLQSIHQPPNLHN